MLPFEIKKEENLAIVKVREDLFGRDIIVNACYAFLDRAFIVLDKEGEYLVIYLKPKFNEDLENIAFEFYSQVISEYSISKISKENEKIREMIIEQALSNYVEEEQLEMEEEAYRQQEEIREEVDKAMTAFRSGEESVENVEDLFVEDPLGIAKPWEEKYGKGNTNKNNQ